MAQFRLTRNQLHYTRLKLPASKSISNRLLVMEALAGKDAEFKNLSEAEDTLRMKSNLEGIRTCASSRIPMVVDAGNAGTVFRFLTGFLAITKGKWLLTGNDRMLKRPVREMVVALQSLGTMIEYKGQDSYPPLSIQGAALEGGHVEVDPSKSSQFVTALMMIAPYLKNGLEINLSAKPVSKSYIRMTAHLMEKCGAKVVMDKDHIYIKPGDYKFEKINIEPDWSSVSYWYEIVSLVADSEIFIEGFQKESVQGDRICAEIFEKLGVQTVFEKDGIKLKNSLTTSDSFEFNFTDYPDLVPAVMASCAAKGIPANFRGIGHLQFKESDRIKSLDTELSKIGVTIEIEENMVRLIPGKGIKKSKNLVFDTHNDHRIAMCLAPLISVFENMTINDPEVVSKSYPSFWEDIIRSGLAQVERS